MKRIVTIVLTLSIAVFLFVWGASLIRCDALTLRYGDLFRFVKQDGAWVLVSWGAVWSSMGSADGFLWPYGREIIG